MHKRWLFVLLQTLVTAGLLAIFFHDAEFRRDALEALRHAHPGWIVAGVLVAGVENVIGALRWRIFLRMLGLELSFGKCVQVCLVALFCNTFLLGAAGGDLVRAAYLIRRGAGKTNALLSVVMDRVCGLAALIIYTVVLAAWNFEWLMRGGTASLFVQAVFAYEAVCVGLVAGSLFVAMRGYTKNPPRWVPFPEFVRKAGDGYAQFARQWPATLAALGLSLAMALGYFAVFFCAARAFGAPIGFVHLSALMPVADIISSLPISIGGMGIREGVFVVLLGELAGIPRAVAVPLSLVGYLINISWGLVGAAILPLFKGLVRDARQAQPEA